MMGEPAPKQLCPEYELVQGSRLLQGDILENLPVYVPVDLSRPFGPTGREAEFKIQDQDVIIVTQSCDMVEGQSGSQEMILVCPIWKLSDGALDPRIQSGYIRNLCRRGLLLGYHMLPECGSKDYSREISVVSFRDEWSLPLAYVRAEAAKSAGRLRLRPPIREEFSQAFAKYFMRVGLETPIPAFQSDKDAEKVAEKLANLSPESRAQIVAFYQ
jgi:hypothetical protein